jgi:DNA-3-methyladenine glycosylase I
MGVSPEALEARRRCAWAGSDPLMAAYHDEEWGVPCHQEQALFERLVLEGQQAGLSWATILRKREAFRRAFADFDPAVVAGFGDADVERLLQDASIVRNRLKIRATVQNARAFLRLQAEEDSFDRWLWSFVGGEPLRVRPLPERPPATTPASDTLSRALKQRGFTFVGSTIAYAFMQSVGMVDDHGAGCWRYVG